jgi:hypothetical protein
MRRFSGLLALLALLPLTAHAQQGQGSVQLLVGVPQGAFGDRLDGALGFGVGGQLLYQLPATPIAFGVEGGFLIYGQETFRECLTSCRVQVDVVTTNNIGMGHLLLRLQPPSGTVRPYGDAFLGMSYLYTDSRVRDVDQNRPDLASSTNFDDLAFSYGVGGGLQATAYRGVTQEEGRPYEVAIDARLRYVFGSEAEYLKRGSIREDVDGRLTFDVERSRTDLLLPQIGVTLRF